MDWKEFGLKLATSEAAITLACMIVLYAFHFFKQKFQWNTEKWEGVVALAFNAAEQAGLKTGNEKADFALKIFAVEYEKAYKSAPTLSDLKDAALDFARLAYDLKFAKGA